jgi:hypothetical protein
MPVTLTVRVIKHYRIRFKNGPWINTYITDNNVMIDRHNKQDDRNSLLVLSSSNGKEVSEAVAIYVVIDI